MNLKSLLGSCLAASFLAACSGGAGSVAPNVGAANSGGNGSIGEGIQLKLSAPFSIGATNISRRSPKFIGTNVTTIQYTFLPGPISGSFTNTAPNTFTGCTASGMPVVQTCNVIAGPGTYSLTVTLLQGSTVVGSGTAAGIVVTSGNVVSAPVSINPINSTPALSIPGTPKAFYNDGTMQTINLTANELDPAGDIITMYYGPVGNYPNLTFNDAGGITNITVTLTSGGNTSQVVIPFISLADNASNPTPGNVTFAGIGATNTQQVTVTESTTAASGGLDANFVSSSAFTPCGAHATFSPALGPNATNIAGPTASVTYTITAVDTGIISCELDVSSATDASLTVPIILNFPGSVGVGVTGHSRH
jgi:hypothetical protein